MGAQLTSNPLACFPILKGTHLHLMCLKVLNASSLFSYIQHMNTLKNKSILLSKAKYHVFFKDNQLLGS